MTQKVFITIFTLALAALALLAIRQEQINTVNSMSAIHHDIDKIGSKLDLIKIQIEIVSSPNTLGVPAEFVHAQ